MATNPKNLHRWAVISSVKPYTPPERISSRLCGELDDGTKILTSPIIFFDGADKVETLSGTIYLLQEPAKQWLEKCPDWKKKMQKGFGKRG
jgi:hypothetical protein